MLSIITRRGLLRNKLKTGQSTLELVLAFIAVVWLAVGITRIWTWFNVNYANRQVGYEKTRFWAGQDTTYDSSSQPFDIGSQPLDLTEDWVFRGVPSGKVTKVTE
jgi:cytoskeletal protein RodZ